MKGNIDVKEDDESKAEVVGKWEVRPEKNENADSLADSCVEKKLFSANTYLQKIIH